MSQEQVACSSQDCKICRAAIPPQLSTDDRILWVGCEDCKGWFHLACLRKDEEWLIQLGEANYFCPPCLRSREKESDDEATQENDNQVQALGNNQPLSARNDNAQAQQRPSNGRSGAINNNISKGSYLVRKVTDHYFDNPKGRQFEVIYTDGDKKWHWERDLTRCLAKVDAYCASKKLPKSQFKPKGKCGATLDKPQNPANWLEVEEICRLARSFGKKKGLQPVPFSGLGRKDSLGIHQMGEHAYVLLWIPSRRICFVADGLNTFLDDEEVKEDLTPLLREAKVIKGLRYDGQKGADHCGSSAAALAVELQRLYPHGPEKIPETLSVQPSTAGRIVKIAHKEESSSVTTWKPIGELTFGIHCPTCGAKMKGKSRAALNFHKCPGSN